MTEFALKGWQQLRCLVHFNSELTPYWRHCNAAVHDLNLKKLFKIFRYYGLG